MKIRFTTLIIFQLIAFFGGIIAAVYLSCDPTSKAVPPDFKKKLQICCSTFVERSTQLVNYTKSKWAE